MTADLQTVSRAGLAEKITGGLSITQKMPCPSWGISATRCQLGTVLATKPGSTCSECYALKGRYLFPNVQRKLERRYQGLFHPLWTPSMVFLINWFADKYFRWFDSGDLQGVNHLRNINTVARHTPGVQHWLPTREIDMVRQALRQLGAFEPNLCVRVSAAMVDGKPPRMPHTSVVTTEPMPEAFACPSLDQGNSCADCRQCWSEEAVIAYRLH